MRYLLIFWALPVGFLVGWYGLSYHDINFGTIFLSRALHDAVFEVYGEMIGIAPDKLPWLVLDAIVFDTFLILGLFAFRRRRQIRAWWVARKAPAGEGWIPSAMSDATDGTGAPRRLYSPAE